MFGFLSIFPPLEFVVNFNSYRCFVKNCHYENIIKVVL